MTSSKSKKKSNQPTASVSISQATLVIAAIAFLGTIIWFGFQSFVKPAAPETPPFKLKENMPPRGNLSPQGKLPARRG